MDLQNSIGEIFLQARKEKGLTCEQVAQELCLSAERIAVLEELEKVDAVHDVYTRAHLQSYARFLGLSEVADFSGTEPANDFQARPFNNIPDEYTHRLIRLWGTLSVVIIIAVLFSFWWYEQEWAETKDNVSGKQDASVSQRATSPAKRGIPGMVTIFKKEPAQATEEFSDESTFQSVESPQNSAHTDDVADTRLQEKSEEALVAPQGDDNSPQSESPTHPISPVTRQPGDDNSPQSESPILELTLRSKGVCWAYIADSTGTVLVERFLPAGYETIVHGFAPLEVRLGNGPVIEMEVNGIPYDFSEAISPLDTAFFDVGVGSP